MDGLEASERRHYLNSKTRPRYDCGVDFPVKSKEATSQQLASMRPLRPVL